MTVDLLALAKTVAPQPGVTTADPSCCTGGGSSKPVDTSRALTPGSGGEVGGTSNDRGETGVAGAMPSAPAARRGTSTERARCLGCDDSGYVPCGCEDDCEHGACSCPAVLCDCPAGGVE